MGKSIIIYFSRADENYNVGYIEKGNTEVVAEFIQEFTNSRLFKVEPLIPYSKDYKSCIEEAKMRANYHKAPIKESIPALDDYDVLYIGSPIYWGGMPEELKTALKEVNFEGKIIRPFVTHEGSGFASVLNELKEICKNATIEKGLAIQGSKAKKSKPLVEKWLSN